VYHSDHDAEEAEKLDLAVTGGPDFYGVAKGFRSRKLLSKSVEKTSRLAGRNSGLSRFLEAKLGPYEILAPIGAGGMGEVYGTYDPRLERDVAIKVSAAQFSERFEGEAHAIAALNRSNI